MDDEEKLLRALDACLERIERGDAIDACLHDYPAERGELEPLLRAAASLRALPAPPPPNLEAIEQSVLAHAAKLRYTAASAPAIPHSYSAILLVAAALAALAILIGAFLILSTLFGGAPRTPPAAPPRPSVTAPATVPAPIRTASPTPLRETTPPRETTPTMFPTATPTMLPTTMPTVAPTATFLPTPVRPPEPPPAPVRLPEPPPAVSPSPEDDDDNDDDDNDDDDDDNDDD